MRGCRFFATCGQKKRHPHIEFAGPILGPPCGLIFRTELADGNENVARNPGPILGPFLAQIWDFFGTPFAQVLATWRWNAFLRSQCPSGKRCVYINMDETCIHKGA